MSHLLRRLRRISALALVLVAEAAALPARADVTISEALALLDGEIAVSPQDPALWQRRAALERRRADRARASADLTRAEALGLSPVLVARDRALILLDEGRTSEAEALLRGARRQAPDDVTLLLPHARALAALGRWRAAADTYTRIVRLAPDASPDVHLERVRVLGAGGPAATDEALAAIDEAQTFRGAVPALEQEALALELRAGRLDAALTRLDRLAAASQRPERVLVQRAELLERAGRADEAAAAYGAALAAMQSLPPQRRATPAASELERYAQAGVARIAARVREGR